MSIFGDGALEPSMRREEVAQLELDRQVELPRCARFSWRAHAADARQEIDLFVCCHRQGDPSCTYLETMAAGVPDRRISNEAFAGLTDWARSDVSSPLGDVKSLADEIARLARDREALTRRAATSALASRANTPSSASNAGIDHLRGVASQGPRTMGAPWRDLVGLAGA